MRDARQRLVHRHVHVGIAGDAAHVAERLLHRLAERDADVLGGVVVVDMQVALGLDGQVDARMARQQIEHVVEEADAGRNRRCAGAVEIDRDLDVGFLGGALDAGLAHAESLKPPGLLSGTGRLRHCSIAARLWADESPRNGQTRRRRSRKRAYCGLKRDGVSRAASPTTFPALGRVPGRQQAVGHPQHQAIDQVHSRAVTIDGGSVRSASRTIPLSPAA